MQNLLRAAELAQAGINPLMPKNVDFTQENPELFRFLDITISQGFQKIILPTNIVAIGAGFYVAYEACRMQAEKNRTA